MMSNKILAGALAAALGTPAAYAAGVNLWVGGAAGQVINRFYTESNSVLVGEPTTGPVPGALVSSFPTSFDGGMVGVQVHSGNLGGGLIQQAGMSYIHMHGSLVGGFPGCGCRLAAGAEIGYTMATGPVALSLMTMGGMGELYSEARVTPIVTVTIGGVRVRYSQPAWAVPSLLSANSVATAPRIISVETEYAPGATAEVGYLRPTQPGIGGAGFVGVKSPKWVGVQLAISGVVAQGDGAATPGPFNPSKPWRSGAPGVFGRIMYHSKVGEISAFYGNSCGSQWSGPDAYGYFQKTSIVNREFGIEYQNAF